MTARHVDIERGPDLTADPTRDTGPSGRGTLQDIAVGPTSPAGVLRMAATSLHRSHTALGASFRRIARYKGGGVFATARQLARLIYRMLRYSKDYVDIGDTADEAQFQHRCLAAITQTAKQFGYTLIPQMDNG